MGTAISTPGSIPAGGECESQGGTTVTMTIRDPKRLYPRPALTSKAVPN
jgi:hypothetical protein